ncbi:MULTISPECIES: hypothetical protein [Vagococcus]|uniref:hypothetical protein n=1 Tax=Vagococcus TaxID=2737 RepID=UPI000E4EFC88|nr:MULTISPECIES: hypothetical protein [Vagococcus]RHH71222.1 hypothetical protein DW196_01410 [Vagococcus sp. AM17-17]
MKLLKRIVSILILLVIIGGVGYYFYTEQIKGGSPDIVAKDTGSIDLSKIEQTVESNTGEGKYQVTFDSWDALDEKAKDGVYSVDEYPNTSLYLVSATKQADGKILAVFDDAPIKDK